MSIPSIVESLKDELESYGFNVEVKIVDDKYNVIIGFRGVYTACQITPDMCNFASNDAWVKVQAEQSAYMIRKYMIHKNIGGGEYRKMNKGERIEDYYQATSKFIGDTLRDYLGGGEIGKQREKDIICNPIKDFFAKCDEIIANIKQINESNKSTRPGQE
jgi:hypothetical protein